MRAQRPHDAVYKLRYLGWATGGDPGLLPIMEEGNRFGLKNVLATGRMSALEDRILALADLVEIHVNDNHNMKKPSKGIRKLFKSHSRLVFRVFLTVDNVGTLPLELFKFLDAVDPDRLVPVRVSIFHSSRTIMLPEEGVSEKGLHDAAREIRSMLFDQGRLLFRADPRFYSGHCCEFGRDLSIDPAGGVYVCPYSRKPFWSLGSDSPSSVLKESLELHRQAMVTSLEECGSCDLQNICRGRCRLPYLKDGSIDRTMTCCSPAFREHIYDRMLDNDSIYY
jgi:radical SAM protein with 4Fe4S-binding SPASM domain